MKFGMINVWNIMIIVIMMIPNIIYAVKSPDAVKLPAGRLINVTEQIGRYASIALMVIPLGMRKFGFSSVVASEIYFFGNIVLLFAYLIVWGFYFKKKTLRKASALAILPVCVFLLCGITLRHWLLVAAAIIFGIGHITITYYDN